MQDIELDALLEQAEKGSKVSAAAALFELAGRVLDSRRLTAAGAAAIASAMIRALKDDKALQFFGTSKVGRPKGGAQRMTLHVALQRYGALKGWVAPDKAVIGDRQLRRDRAALRGEAGKPGRPRKPDIK